MKTNIIYTVLALFIVGCSNDEPVVNSQIGMTEIDFEIEDIPHYSESRTYTELSNEILQEAGFAVYSYTNDPSTSTTWLYVFSAEQVKYNESNNVWNSAQNHSYWIAGNSYRFFGIAPYEAISEEYVSIAYGSAGTTITTTFDNEKANGEVDLMWAYKEMKKIAANSDGSFNNAKLTFRHALSRLKFQFTNVPENATITNVTLKNAILKGSNEAASSIYKNDSNYSQKDIWTSINSGDLNLGKATINDAGEYYTQPKFNIPYVVEKTVSIAYTVNGTTYDEDEFATYAMKKGGSYIILVDLSFLNTISDEGNDDNGDNNENVVPDATRAPKSAHARRSHAKIIDEGQY
jgi:hypothetical protein